MRYPIVVNKQDIPKLPAIEHHVLPHDVSDVLQIGFRYFAAITEASVKAHPHGSTEREEDVLEQPVHPGEKVVLEDPQTLVDAIELTGKHRPMKNLIEETLIKLGTAR